MIELAQANNFLSDYYQTHIEATYLGAGAWSRCYGYKHNGRDWVVRFGKHVADFQTDQLAHQFNAPNLPIPEVLDIGETFDQYYAISEQVFGVPLESVTAEQWTELVPAVAAAFEAMRQASLPPNQGVGELRSLGKAAEKSWSQLLLSVGDETDDARSHGRLQKLAQSSIGLDLFNRGLSLLEKTASDEIPIGLTHRDLVNRNVLVQDGRISGIFDWGCSLLGDPLYELAWFDYCAPWLPNLDVPLLKMALKTEWDKHAYQPDNYQERMTSNHLHICLDHLAYNASVGDEENLVGTAKQMIKLVPELA